MSEDHTEFDCKRCGKHEKNTYFKDVHDRLLASRLCHTCDYWQQKIAIRDRKNVARIGGTHYVITPETSGPNHCKGFGGDRYKIRFDDGRVVETTNLWCQGGIPADVRADLPDNAVFLEPVELAPSPREPAEE